MPFFGGTGKYIIVGTNIKGGNDAAPAVIGDNNMALGNGALKSLIDGDGNIAIGNNAGNSIEDNSGNIIIGHDALASGPASNSIILNSLSTYAGSTISGSFISGSVDVSAPENDVTIEDSIFLSTGNGQTLGDFSSLSASILLGEHGPEGFLGGQYFGCILIGQSEIGTDAYQDVIAIGNGLGTVGSNSITIDGEIGDTPENGIRIGNESHTSIFIGGIDFSAGPGGANTYVRERYYAANYRSGTYSTFGMDAPSTTGVSDGFITGTTVYSVGCNVYSSSSSAGNSGGWRSNDSAGILATMETQTTFLLCFNDNVATSRSFVGLRNVTTVIGNVDPSTLTNLIGVGHDSGDTNLSIIHNDGSGTATKIELGADFPANGTPSPLYNVTIETNGSSSYFVTVTNINDGTVSDTYEIDTDIPSNTTYLTWHVWRNNGTTGTKVSTGLSQVFMKTNFNV